jgi:hypothetical protein
MRKTKPLSPHKARKIPGRPAKPAERPAPPTADELLGRIGEVLGKVDALMEKRKSTMPWNFPGYNSPLWQHAQEVKALIDQLSDALNPDDEPEKRYGGRRAAIAAWTTKPGQPCTWARPGSFLLHAGIIPVRCQWGGVLDTTTICAVDPKQPLWFSTHWQIPFTVQRIEPKRWRTGLQTQPTHGGRRNCASRRPSLCLCRWVSVRCSSACSAESNRAG